jgi:trehalose/maltose hydrolase-like predicted phosphorylase
VILDEYANFRNNAAFVSYRLLKYFKPSRDVLQQNQTNAGISVILNNAIKLGKIVNTLSLESHSSYIDCSHLQVGASIPSNWSRIAKGITILKDPSSGITLEYDGFNGTTAVKQADVVVSYLTLAHLTDSSI